MDTSTSPVDASKVALVSVPWESSRAVTVNVYRVFGDRELTEPNTMFGPYVAKAMGLFGELWGATVILYELAPEYLVHLKITVWDVVENTDAWKADERDESVDHYSTCLSPKTCIILQIMSNI